MKNREEYAAWVQAAWEKEVLKSTPLARSIRSAKAGNQALKREHKATRRSLAAKHAAQSRAIRNRQVEAELVLKQLESAREAEMAKRRWDLLMGKR